MADLDRWNARGIGRLPGLIGIEFKSVEPHRVHARLSLRPEHLAPNGFLHAATVVALADTACGYGCLASLPKGSEGFATIELKTNFVGTEREGAIFVIATMAHGGRTTQVWDATVKSERDDRTIALFRCTQLVLYPRAEQQE